MQSRHNFTWLCGVYDACRDANLYLLGVEVTSWGPLILTAVVPVGGTLCEVAVFCYNKFGSGGTCG